MTDRLRNIDVAVAALLGGLFDVLFVAVGADVAVVDRVDQHVVAAAQALVLAHPWLLRLTRGVTLLGAPVTVDLLVLGVVVLALAARRPRVAVYLAVVRLGTQAATTVIKQLVGRDRPVLAHPVAHATGFSFPSGHASGAASTYFSLALAAACLPAVQRRCRPGWLLLAAAALSLAVAASRMCLGVHYPTDVTAGFALGAALAFLSRFLLQRPAGHGQLLPSPAAPDQAAQVPTSPGGLTA